MAQGRSRWRSLRTAALLASSLLPASFAIAQTASGAFEQHVAEAVQAQSSGDTAAAISEYKSALALQPGAAEIWANLGLMQHQAKDYRNATSSFTKAHQLRPKLFVPVFFLGLEDLNAGKLAEAVSYFTTARGMKPDDPNVPMYLGSAYFDLKKFNDAASAYDEAVRLNPANGEAWYRLGIAHLKASEQDSGRLAEANRRSPYFAALAADSLSSQNKLDRAAEAYSSALAERSHPPCLQSSLGFVLLRQGKLAEAESEFEQDIRSGGCLQAQLGMLRLAFDRDPVNATLAPLGTIWKIDRGFIESHATLIAQGLPPDQFSNFSTRIAATTFPGLSPEEVTELRASLSGAQRSPSNHLEAVGQAPSTEGASAVEDFRSGHYRRCSDDLRASAAALLPNKLSVLAACSFFTGDYKDTLDASSHLRRNSTTEDEGLYWAIRARQTLAVGCLLRAGETSPNSIRVHELLAETYRDMSRYGAAEAEYEAALKIAPDDFAALLGAAANYLQEYRIEPADKMIRRALQQNPSDPEANYIMGEVLIDEHQFDQAESYLKIGLSAKPELVPRVHALLGQVYASRGDDARAIEELKLGEASDDDGSIHFQLGRLYQKTGQQTLAAAAFERTRQLQNKEHN